MRIQARGKAPVLREVHRPVPRGSGVDAAEEEGRRLQDSDAAVAPDLAAVCVAVEHQADVRMAALELREQRRRWWAVDQQAHRSASGLRGEVGAQPAFLAPPVSGGKEAIFYGPDDKVPPAPIKAIPGGAKGVLIL